MKKKYLGKCCGLMHHSIFKMLLTLKLTAFLLLFSATLALAQQVSVSGKVTDSSNGQALPGVTIVVRGTTQGTVSTIDGNYTLPNVPSNGTLQFSFIGMKTQEVAVGGRTTINLTMEQDAIGLDEVIAIGYGTQRRRDVTSAITVVSAGEIAKQPTANLENALQGLAPGVLVTGSRGTGSIGDITIRGTSSISGNTEPLYVIDGIPQDGSYVNPSDIESLQILKDAASSAIYGSRGSNGVVLITTKSGSSGVNRNGEPSVRYSGYLGWEKAWKLLDPMSTEEWAALVYESNKAIGGSPPALATYIVEHNGGKYTAPETDWQDWVFQTGAISENNLDVSGRTNAGNYFFSAGQYAQEGILVFTPFKRYSIRMNSNWRTGNFSFGENISFIYSENRNESATDGRTTQEEINKMTTNVPVYNADGSYAGSAYIDPNYTYTDPDPTKSLNGSTGHDAWNAYAGLERVHNMSYNKRFMVNLYGEYKIMNDLTFRSTFGVTTSDVQNRNLTLQTIMPNKSYANTDLTENSTWRYNWVWEQMLTYRKTLGDHDINVMGAYTSEFQKNHSMSASGRTIQTDINDILAMTEGNFSVGGTESEQSRISYLGRIMYNFKGKYMLTANVRRDGSSKFGPGNKWGTFPSASLAWNISEESFMDGFKAASQLSRFKLRGSYGIVGNDRPINAYSYISGLSTQTYNNNSVALTGVTVSSFNNPDLKWESSKQAGVGADIDFFRGALALTVDWYHNKTEDMLVGVTLPGSSGSSGSINRNVGSILNKGWEFQATYRKSRGDFRYTITGNLATNYNEVLDLYGTVINAGGVEFGNQSTRTEAGHAIGQFYGYKTLGIFQTQAEIDNYVTPSGELMQPNAAPGDIKFAKLADDGLPINTDDRTYIGNPAPKFNYGLNVSLEYKGLDFTIFFQGVQGNDIYAEMMVWTQGMHNNFNQGKVALNRWTPTNTNTNIPRAVRNDLNGNIMKASDRYIKDGSYLRLKNATIGYTLPKTWVNYIKLSNVRVYATGRNLLTFTKYPFYDPEIGSGAQGTGGTSATSRGIDNGYYPQARALIMGIQLDF